jgi:prevent-host-death family protein
MDVGIKELRDGLSRRLADVRAGHTITVTDHGRPIARIVPVGRPNMLEQLIAEGKVRQPGSRKLASRKPVAARGTVTDLIADQRR